MVGVGFPGLTISWYSRLKGSSYDAATVVINVCVLRWERTDKNRMNAMLAAAGRLW